MVKLGFLIIMNALPNISAQIDEKIILKVIKKNYANLGRSFYITDE